MIEKRGKVYFYNFRWSVRNKDGETENYRIRRSAKTSNKNEARDIEAAHRLALSLGQVHPSDPWPAPKAAATAPVFRAFAKEFMRHAQHHVAPGTRDFYEGCVGRLLAFAPIADASLDEITGDTVSAYTTYRIEVAENSVFTVNGDLRTLRRIVSLAVEWKKLDRAKAPIIHELPQGEGRDRVVTFKEEQLYLAKATENLRDAAVVACDTGMRPNSELFVLCWPNVELTPCPETPHGVIHVRKGKGDNAPRSIPLTPRAAEVLRRRKKEADATKPSPYVFPGDGNAGHLISLQHPHEEAVAAAKLPYFQFYCWRHTYGTRTAQSGMDKYSLARLMGHSSPTITAKYYIHVQESHTAIGFGKFAEYVARGVAQGIAEAFPDATDAIQ